MSADLHSSGKSSFYSSVMRMYEYYNLPDCDPNVLNKSKIKHYISLMQHKYILHWQHSIQHSKKLEFYNTFKNENTPSCYQELASKLNKRKELVKFKIGNHKLMIETGRCSQIPARVNRRCPTCGSNQIEDEIHLLFHCPKYSIFRDRFYRVTRKHWPQVRGPVQRTWSTDHLTDRSMDHLTDRSMDHLYGPPLLTPSKNSIEKKWIKNK